jgi:acetyl-CoA carboxylase biotin carboxyl carrier protein
MDIDQIRQILELVREHELAEFEFEQEGLRLKVRKEGGQAVMAIPAAAPVPLVVPTAPIAGPVASAALSQPPAVAAEANDAEIELEVLKSPIVGTFYRAPEPGAPPFVEVGSVVKKGQVLCIIEAMKLMNEIDSEYDGEVVNIYAENGQPVQYNERLFAIRTR